jgi:hypothetical protein
MTGISSSSEPGCGDGFYTARDARNQRRFTLWMLAAALAYLGATAALRWRAALPGALAWLPPTLTGLAGLLAILAIRRYVIFLRQADELLRRIQTEALAFGFGAGAVVAMLYPLLEMLGAPRLGGYAIALVMMLAWSAGSWLGTRRYAGRDADEGDGNPNA